jgi:nitrate/TMAO reductase-like tetraheme cytochrome c subunit
LGVDQLHTRSSSLSPDCATCHGHHGVARPDDPESPVYWQNVPGMCARCHANPAFAKMAPQVDDYLLSVHGRSVLGAKPAGRPAVCTDCHFVHGTSRNGATSILPAYAELPHACGQCHKEQATAYAASVHGQAPAAGMDDAPACTDCHGEDGILRPSDPHPSVSAEGVVTTCDHCHGDTGPVLLHEFPTERAKTMPSYHGDIRSANCASCHGAHDVLATANPASRVHPDNLSKTCGGCHPGVGAEFPISRAHIVPTPREGRWLFWLKTICRGVVCATILFFLGYICVDLWTHRRLKRGHLHRV